MNRVDFQQLLTRKLQVTEVVIAKTETQLRFINKRQMKGLRRVLQERQSLIDELERITETLEADNTGWKMERELQPLLQEIAAKSLRMIQLSEEAVKTAIAERAAMAGELRQMRMKKSVNQTYFRPWQGLAVGRNFSVKG